MRTPLSPSSPDDASGLPQATSFVLPHLPPLPPLPVDGIRSELTKTLASEPILLLEAPPGTGKSTRVPLWALEALPGRILLLEPRRVAARMLARHLAALLHVRLGDLVGLAMRKETVMSARTRLLVVTEGVFTRMIREDQNLTGISAVLFDEFHERNLASDTGLALATETQAVLRPDLHLAVLSATLDTASLMAVYPDAPLLRCENPGFPVTVRYEPLPNAQGLPPQERMRALPGHMAAAVRSVLAREKGSILAFLPGAREIRATADLLEGTLPNACDICPLFSRLGAREQELALAPAPPGRRKVVLTTDIAETSLTIEGIRTVIDSGLMRRPRFDSATSRSHLVTLPVTLASATQRAGRAGRTEPGLCIRLWSRGSEAAMAPHARPEILETDLTELVLDLALWGSDASDLPFLTQPPETAIAAGRNVLVALGALDGNGRSSKLGQAIGKTGLPVRDAAVLLALRDRELAQRAALACAVLEDTASPSARDLDLVLERAGVGKDAASATRTRSLARLLLARAASVKSVPERTPRPEPLPEGKAPSTGFLLLPGYGDRLAMQLAQDTRHHKANGTATESQAVFQTRDGRRWLLPKSDPLASAAFLLILDGQGELEGASAGSQGYGRIGLACRVTESEVNAWLSGSLREEVLALTDSAGRVSVVRRTRLDALVLGEKPVPNPDPEMVREALTGLVREKGFSVLPVNGTIRDWLSRLAFLRKTEGDAVPDFSEKALLARTDEWLPELLSHRGTLASISPEALHRALQNLLPWDLRAKLARLAPESWQAPSGRMHPVRYEERGPVVEVKLQECFGLTAQPETASGVPFTLHLNSPAGAPLAVTCDLAYFWKDVYPSVRAEMRGRYPKHPWPEDPLSFRPTALTNRRLAREGGKAEASNGGRKR